MALDYKQCEKEFQLQLKNSKLIGKWVWAVNNLLSYKISTLNMKKIYKNCTLKGTEKPPLLNVIFHPY